MKRLSLTPILLTLCVLLLLSTISTTCTVPILTPNTTTLLKDINTSTARVISYHFHVDIHNPGLGGLFTFTTIDGDTIIPNKLTALATAQIGDIAVQLRIITIGRDLYATIPLVGLWLKTRAPYNAQPLQGMLGVLSHIQLPSTPYPSSVDNRGCWAITGQVNALDLTTMIGYAGIFAVIPNLITIQKAATVTVCAGDGNNLPYSINIHGIVIIGDTPDTDRTFTFSNFAFWKFGKKLTITAPI